MIAVVVFIICIVLEKMGDLISLANINPQSGDESK